MDIRKVHILIEQKLQQVGVFAYDDFQSEEVDLQIDASVFKILKSAFNPIRQDNQFQYNQGVLDRIRTLQKTEQVLPIDRTEDYYNETDLPEDYIHKIRISALVALPEQCTVVECNNIEAGKTYIVKQGHIRYVVENSTGNEYIELKEGDSFIGVEGVTEYEFFPDSLPVKLLQPKSKKVRCRVIESHKIDEVLENSLSKTKVSSPVVEITEEIIRSYFSDFIINNLIFSYIRTPSPVNFNFQRYTAGDTLTAGIKYEVISGTISINSIETYGVGQVFTPVMNTTFTGTGTVRVYLDGDLVLPLPVCYDVINDVAQELAIISEQSQQKIVNLAQKDNVPS